MQETSFEQTCTLLLRELQQTLAQVDAREVQAAATALLAARRVFFHGAGRSGLALRMAAMRMMHLGLSVYVAGETTAPAIEADDLLVVASGSGTTAGPLRSAQTAKARGAGIVALTTSAQSPLGLVATTVVTIPAATKQGDDRTLSQQYAGALFEQAVLLLMDALFQQLWAQSGQSAEQLWTRHANLE